MYILDITHMADWESDTSYLSIYLSIYFMTTLLTPPPKKKKKKEREKKVIWFYESTHVKDPMRKVHESC